MKLDIIGSVASGKTTLARELSEIYNIPFYQKDNIVWERTPEGDKKRSDKDRDELFQEIINGDNWIVEGSPRKLLRESFGKCDYIILLEVPLCKRLVRIIKRWLRQRAGKEGIVKIYFARHGQTDWNTLGKVQGTTDIPLNENGIAQAQLLCKKLEEKDISFEKIYTSYQARAVKTAQIIDEHFHTGYEIVRGLEEMNLGLFEGHTWDEILSLYDEEHKLWLSNKRYNCTPDGESYQMVMERLFKALDYILGQHNTSSDKNLLIISHGAVIMTLLAMKRNIPFEQSHTIEVDNASPIEFSIEELEGIRERL